MAYVAPTSSDLKTRFPAFGTVDDAIVTSALAEASRLVDQTWTDGDFALAQMLYACHVMTLDGLGTSAEAGLLTDLPLGYSVLKAGDTQISRAPTSSTGSAAGYLATSYGARFYQLLRRNVAGVSVT